MQRQILSGNTQHRLAFEGTNGAISPGEAWIPLDVESLLSLEAVGARPTIPDVLYDADACNRIALEIYDCLLEAFAECGALLADSGRSKYLNLVAVFFHEILRVLCAYCFKRHELDSISAHYSLASPEVASEAGIRSPYVGYDFVLAPPSLPKRLAFERQGSRPNARQLAGELLGLLRHLVGSFGKRSAMPLLCTSNVASEIRQIASPLTASSGKRWSVRLLKPWQVSITIPLLKEQLGVLRSHLAGLSSRGRSQTRPCNLDLPDELLVLTERWIMIHLEGRPRRPLRAAALLTGSLVEPKARIAAARAKAEGIPVISVFHGESCGAHDEPVFGYGEKAFADVVVGYGELGCKLALENERARPLYDDPIIYVPSASDKMRAMFSGKPIPPLAALKSPRFMYVPTSLTGDGRYGPYRDMHDVAYLEWQRSLMACVGQEAPGRVIWKLHTKDRVKVEASIPGVAAISERFFEDVMDAADVFIFDYLSTAFSLAAATSKPIIYLDIGLRNLAAQAMEAVQDRCIYVRADPRQPQDAFCKALELADKACMNRYTTSFCLPADPRPRHEVIAEAILKKCKIGS